MQRLGAAPDVDGVYAVIVTYGRDPAEAAALPLMRAWLRGESGSGSPMLAGLLVWDNSPTSSGVPAQAGIAFRHDPSNGGTRAAYACAAANAADRGAQWVLFLDQDTVLPADFPERIGCAVRAASARNTPPAALVPRVVHNDRLVSPARITASGAVRPAPLSQTDVDGPDGPGRPTAIASGALVRTAELSAVLPAPVEFWLDYLDHWLFRRLLERGGTIAPIDCELRHSLSVASSAPLSAARFTNVLRAERAFVGRPGLAVEFAYRLRLAARALRWSRGAPELSRIAWQAALGRRP